MGARSRVVRSAVAGDGRRLRNAALSGALVKDTIKISSPNDLLDSFRPEWRA